MVALPAPLTDWPSPAKLNLFLHVLGRRDDGYHLLQSVFVLIDWCDTLHFEARADGLLQRHDLAATLPADDLCLRAARALQSASGTRLGADISIRKQVPWGAGMGGGSSNAATTLLGLNRLWGLHWPRKRLLPLAIQLGADVPFFLMGRNAWVEGIGEQITPIDWQPQRFCVLKPPTSLPTAAIFSSPLLARNTKPATVESFLGHEENFFSEQIDGQTAQQFGHNDLQAAAQALCEEVSFGCGWLEKQFGNGRMTGSGSAVFASLGRVSALGATNSGKNSARNVSLATRLSELPAGWIGKMCDGLSQHPLLDVCAD
jgi:4-diphosphocytidyl-2-C-methyl-D-erythritol kinase